MNLLKCFIRLTFFYFLFSWKLVTYVMLWKLLTNLATLWLMALKEIGIFFGLMNILSLTQYSNINYNHINAYVTPLILLFFSLLLNPLVHLCKVFSCFIHYLLKFVLFSFFLLCLHRCAGQSFPWIWLHHE